MRPARRIFEREGEFPSRINLGARRYLHAIREVDKHNLVPGGRFVGRAIGDGAREGLGVGGKGEK